MNLVEYNFGKLSGVIIAVFKIDGGDMLAAGLSYKTNKLQVFE
jgi:hypothetical protein